MAKSKAPELPDYVRMAPDAIVDSYVLIECDSGYEMFKLKHTVAEVYQFGESQGPKENGGILRRRLARLLRIPI